MTPSAGGWRAWWLVVAAVPVAAVLVLLVVLVVVGLGLKSSSGPS
jgi:hypothetical protein